MRVVVVLLLAVAALAGCADDGPRFGSKVFPAAALEGRIGHFDAANVRAYWFVGEPYGERREIHFIASGPRGTHVRQARECVAHHLERDVAAPFCFAYPTQRAFRAARFARSNGQTSRNCWSARAQKPIDDQQISAGRLILENRGHEGCPDLAAR